MTLTKPRRGWCMECEKRTRADWYHCRACVEAWTAKNRTVPASVGHRIAAAIVDHEPKGVKL